MQSSLKWKQTQILGGKDDPLRIVQETEISPS